MGYYLGVDLGGTNIHVGVCDEEYRITGHANIRTNLPRPAQEIADDIIRACHLAVADAEITMEDVACVGIGSPGAVDPEQGLVIFASNLQFDHVPLAKMVQLQLGKKVYIENDASAAAYGEVLAGAAKGKKTVIAITLGTGVGGGFIIDGQIYSGHNHCGAELGHIVIEQNGLPCSCGRRGCLEAYCSATALIRATQKQMIDYPSSKMWDLVNHDLDAVNGRTAFDAMRLGDPSAQEVVDRYINYLSTGIVNCVNIFQPECVLIGGGISNEKETLLKPLREAVRKEAYGASSTTLPELRCAELGNNAGIIGAAFLFRMPS